MTGHDELDAIPPKHRPVNVSDEMRRAAEPAPERVTRPSNAHEVERIAKRTTTER